MLKIRLAAVAAIILGLAAVSAPAQQPAKPAPGGPVPDGKIVVINTTVFPAQIGELKTKYDQVDGTFKDRSDKLKTVETQLRNMENEMRTKGPGWSPDIQQQKQAEYDDLKKRGTRDYEDLKGEYDRAVEAATKPIRDKLYQFLEKYAAQRQIVLVLNLAGIAQSQSLAYWHPSADITDDFIAEYNKANPSAAAPSPQPAAPVRPATRPPGNR
jgi:outer membrane protein